MKNRQGQTLFDMLLMMALSLMLLLALLTAYQFFLRLLMKQEYAASQLQQAWHLDAQWRDLLQGLTGRHCAAPSASVGSLRALAKLPVFTSLQLSAQSPVLQLHSCRYFDRRWQWLTTYVFIARSKTAREDGLYEKINHSPATKLAASVRQMQLTFIERAANTQALSHFINYQAVTHWSRVVLLHAAFIFAPSPWQQQAKPLHWLITSVLPHAS